MVDLEKIKIVSDNVHETIICSGLENEIIRTPIFNRLHRVSQSSLVFLTFPSNRVKRFEHSVGTMHLAGQLFCTAICNSEECVIDSLMQETKNRIVEWRSNTLQKSLPRELKQKMGDDILRDGCYPNCSMYNEIPRNIKEDDMYAYLIIYESIRIAALLHDIGHLPYSHILENALKDIYRKVCKDNEVGICDEVKNNFINIMENFAGGIDKKGKKDEIHEELGKLLVDNIEQSILENMSQIQKKSMEYFFVKLCFAFAKNILNSTYYDNNIFADLHLIISGVIDADRLDYCTRDAFCASINKDIFNYKRFFCGYKIIQRTDELSGDYKHYLFAPSTKNLLMIEDLLRKRYRIFSDINFHHEVHKHELILEEIISRLGILELQNETSTNFQGITSLPMEVSSIWNLAKEIKQGTVWLEYQLIQMDDSWLDTLLKNKFFEIYGENCASISENGTDVQWNLFDELISTREHYFSLIKRSGDFRVIDQEFFYIFIDTKWKNKDIADRIENIKSIYKEKDMYSSFVKDNDSFFFNEVITQWFKISSSNKVDLYYHHVEEMLNIGDDKEVNHCIIRSSRFKNGLNTFKSPVYLIDNNNREVMLEQLSFRKNVFIAEEKLSSPFHMYYLPHYNENDVHCNVNVDNLVGRLSRVLVDSLNEYDK